MSENPFEVFTYIPIGCFSVFNSFTRHYGQLVKRIVSILNNRIKSPIFWKAVQSRNSRVRHNHFPYINTILTITIVLLKFDESCLTADLERFPASSLYIYSAYSHRSPIYQRRLMHFLCLLSCKTHFYQFSA